jgi:transcriptional regulator with XRE-family HTH domain
VKSEPGDIRTQLGARCRALRQKRGLSQLDVVRHFDFSLSHYQKIERGVLDPRLSTLAKLADVYGVSLSVMLKGVGALPGG